MPCLNSQLRTFQNYTLYLRTNIRCITLNFTHKKFKIYLCMKKNTQTNLSSLAAILDAILYQGSLMIFFTNNKVTL